MNSIIRDFNRLDENTLSAGINYNRAFAFGTFTPSLKAGVYTEYRSRDAISSTKRTSVTCRRTSFTATWHRV
jgi:hypothetical protein